MKKIITILLFLVIVVGCSYSVTNPDNMFLGVIKTSSTRKNSTIILFDKDLNVVQKIKSRTAELGTNFNQPSYYENYIYIVPRGLMKKYDDKKIVEIDTDTLKVKEYLIDRINLQKVTANSNYIAATSNLNWNFYISLIDKKTN